MSKDKCPECKGRRYIGCVVHLAGDFGGINDELSTKCPDCNGTGEKKLDSPREKIAELTDNTLASLTAILIKLGVSDISDVEKANPFTQEAIYSLREKTIKQIKALFPDTEAIKKQTIRLTIDYLKMHYCLIATEAIIKEIEKQALKGESNE